MAATRVLIMNTLAFAVCFAAWTLYGVLITYLIDDVVPITAGHDCAYPSGSDHTKVSCTITFVDTQDPYPGLVTDLGDGNDTLAYTNDTDQIYTYAEISLGAGNDRSTDDSPRSTSC